MGTAWTTDAAWVNDISQSSLWKCHYTITWFYPGLATGEYFVFNKLKGNHSISTLFLTSGTSMDINVVLLCDIIEKIFIGFKCVYLIIPLSKSVFISFSLFYIMNYVIVGTGDLLKKTEELCCHVKLCNLSERCFWSSGIINWASFNPNKAYYQIRVSSLWTVQADTLEK